MLPEVQAYFDAIDLTNRESNAARTAWAEDRIASKPEFGGFGATPEEDAAYHNAYFAWRTKSDAERDAIDQARDNGYAKARGFLENSGHPLVRWIAAEPLIHGYSEEAKQALRIIVADDEGDNLALLDAASKTYDWCNVYRNMRRRMLAAGVVTDRTPVPENPARAKIEKALKARGWSDSNIQNSINDLLIEAERRARQ